MRAKMCPRCGKEIDAEEAQGLCAACLVREGLRSEEGDPLRNALEAKLEGHYRVIRLLGRGGMGAVYLARDLALEREVAIKVVNTAGDRSLYERLRREAKTAARLAHPNIVPLHSFGEAGGMPYFVMGYVRGESLADRLRREHRLPEVEARRVLGEIADALDHAHRQGVVHRDVKPDNVLLDDESGRALLTDFGIARAMGGGDGATQSGSVIGTPHYMSPEQAGGRNDIDGRSDIYSLGVTGYAMLAGRLPFEGRTAAELLAKHLTEEPAPLRSFAPSISDSTAQMLERCLAKDAAARWQDARSLKLALGVTEETHLPDALHGVQSKGFPALAIAVILMLVYMLMAAVEGDEWGPGAAAFIGIAFVIAYVFVVTRLRREGFPFAQSQIAIWREPAWWLWWFPRVLRREGNVWRRLPAVVRHLRWSVFAFAAYVCLGFLEMMVLFGAAGLGFNQSLFLDLHWFSVGTMSVIIAAWVILTVRARRTFARTRLNAADVNRVLLSVPPSRAGFWARPHIAPLLEAAPRSEDAGHTDSPHERMQSIIHLASELSGPMRPLGARAAVAARQLVASIEYADGQIAQLIRNQEPGEEERLSGKIEALAGLEEYASMRSLLQRQLELVRDMADRLEEAKASRNRRVELLMTLALRATSLRSGESASMDEVSALCDEIERQAEVLADADRGAGGDEMLTVERTKRPA